MEILISRGNYVKIVFTLMKAIVTNTGFSSNFQKLFFDSLCFDVTKMLYLFNP